MALVIVSYPSPLEATSGFDGTETQWEDAYCKQMKRQDKYGTVLRNHAYVLFAMSPNGNHPAFVKTFAVSYTNACRVTLRSAMAEGMKQAVGER